MKDCKADRKVDWLESKTGERTPVVSGFEYIYTMLNSAR